MYPLWNWVLYVLWLCLTAALLEKRATSACKLTGERLAAQLGWALVLFALPTAALAALNLCLHGQFSLFQFTVLPTGRAAAFLLFQLLVAVTEECFFRGWMQHALQQRMSRAVAVGLTAAAFALLHLTSGLQAVNLLTPLAIGLLFGWAKECFRDCTVPALVLAHLLYDVAIINVAA